MASNKDLPSSGSFFKKSFFFCPVGFKLFLYLRQISLTGCEMVLVSGIGNFVFNGAYFAQKRCVSLCGLRYQLCSRLWDFRRALALVIFKAILPEVLRLAM